MFKKVFALAPIMAIVTRAEENEEEMGTGKVVAWIITAVTCLVILTMLLISCICHKSLKKEETKNK